MSLSEKTFPEGEHIPVAFFTSSPAMRRPEIIE
jgi:hypothetical protein